ncbi:hypothetical protein FHT97_006262 [Rhizobium sp. BK399]|nr:hypothetical protein [Rhizobium sp. BK399]
MLLEVLNTSLTYRVIEEVDLDSKREFLRTF